MHNRNAEEESSEEMNNILGSLHLRVIEAKVHVPAMTRKSSQISRISFQGFAVTVSVLLLAHELADPGLPLATLVLGDSPEPGASPHEAGALSPEHLDELLLAEVLHLPMPPCGKNRIKRRVRNR